MAGEWRDTTLGQVTEFLSGGTPSKNVAKYWSGSTPWVSAKDMKHFRLEDTEDHVTEDGVTNGTKLVPAGTVLLLARGMTLLNDLPICIVNRPMTFNQDVKALRPKPGVRNEFLPYLLLGNKDRLLNLVDLAGHGTGRLNSDELKALDVVLPSELEQRAIAHILGTLDDKIELNRRMNETLETMARVLFKSWFIDFDPVRAKAEGRDAGLPKHLANLFPSCFVDSELGEIPEGWAIGTLADFALLNPESWSKDTRPAVINYVDLSNTKWGRIETAIPYSGQQAPSRAQRVLRPRDTIVGTVRPGNGSYAFVTEEGLTGSTGFAVLRPRRSDYAEFTYLVATASENIEELSHLADGGAYPAIRPEVVAATQVIRPNDKVLAEFAKLVSPLFAKMAENKRESCTLASLRDALLPKLLSGEIRVRQTVSAAINVVYLPDPPPRKPAKKAKDEFIEAVVIAQLVRKLATPQYPLGRMRYNKLAYLARRKTEDDVTQRYVKKAAGPYNPWAKYQGPEKIAKKNGYVQKAKRGLMEGLVPGKNIDQIDRYVSRYPVVAAIEWVINTFRFKKNDDLELLTTVDFAALDLLRERKTVRLQTVKHVIAANKEWAPKLNRAVFCDSNIRRALGELCGLFPATYQK
ncbi:MAG: restriction endonuclease subunit S [Nitrospira sp.]|nr:restriction endonuclease subunit S [Nitrospira sp.]